MHIHYYTRPDRGEKTQLVFLNLNGFSYNYSEW